MEFGFLLCGRLDSDDDFKFDIKGLGIEAGVYFLKEISQKSMLSVDLRLAYAKSDRTYFNIIDQNLIFSMSDTIIRRNGKAKYRNLSFSIPIKYRYKISNSIPMILSIGLNGYFNLIDNTNWSYDEFEYDTINRVNISELLDQEESINQKLFNYDFLIGTGIKSEKLMVEINLSLGSIGQTNDFIMGMD
jgi:hypothetical protein